LAWISNDGIATSDDSWLSLLLASKDLSAGALPSEPAGRSGQAISLSPDPKSGDLRYFKVVHFTRGLFFLA
jgi:hypothetical protein